MSGVWGKNTSAAALGDGTQGVPLFCPKCKSETLIDAKNYMIQVQVERK